MHHRPNAWTPVALAAAAIALPTAALAQDAPTDAPAPSRLSVSVGLDVTTAYFFRGYLQEDSGLIAQPSAEIGAQIVDASDGSPGVSVFFGTWNSAHSEHTGATEDNAKAWYESDLYGGVSLDWDSFSLGASYTFYTYPSSDFNTVQELGLTAGYTLPDDTLAKDVLGDLSLGLYFEVDNSNVSDDEAVYLELGFGPSFDLDDHGATLAIPVTLGFGLDDYYTDSSGDDDLLGFASIGSVVEIPLGSGAYGDWAVSFGAEALFLGSAAEDANSGDDVELLGFVSLLMSY